MEPPKKYKRYTVNAEGSKNSFNTVFDTTNLFKAFAEAERISKGKKVTVNDGTSHNFWMFDGKAWMPPKPDPLLVF